MPKVNTIYRCNVCNSCHTNLLDAEECERTCVGAKHQCRSLQQSKKLADYLEEF